MRKSLYKKALKIEKVCGNERFELRERIKSSFQVRRRD